MAIYIFEHRWIIDVEALGNWWNTDSWFCKGYNDKFTTEINPQQESHSFIDEHRCHCKETCSVKSFYLTFMDDILLYPRPYTPSASISLSAN